MKVAEFIKELKEYPEDTEVLVLGFKDSYCGDWEAYCVSDIDFDLDDNVLKISGEI